MAAEQKSWKRVRGRHVTLAAFAATAYVVLISARASWRFGLVDLVLCAAALALARVASRARSAPLAWAAFGAGLVVATLVEGTSEARVAAFVGAVIASVAGVSAIARVPSLGGIVHGRARSARLGIAFVGVIWAPASVSIAQDALRGRESLLTPWVVASAAGTAALALVLFGAAARLERALELGVAERLSAFLLCALALGAGAVLLVLVGALGAAPAACALCALAGVAACAFGELADPIVLWRGARRATALAGIAVALAGLFEFLLIDQHAHQKELVAALAAGALITGAELPRIVRAVRGGDASRRLAATATARRALCARDADVALASALRALRDAAPPPTAAEPARSPELWTIDPIRSLRVDAAGYAHDEPASLPPELVLVASSEPESTLRAEALAAVEVRRPDLRPLSRWMSDAKISSATLIARGGEIEGVLFLPTYDGIPDLTLEEARALRELADDLAPLCHARARLARSMQREQTARDAESAAEARAERAEHQLSRAAAHHSLAAARLARPAAVGIYSARSRTAYEALERLTKSQAPMAVVAKSGVDPVPFLARAHLAGARGAAPLVLVDGTSTREHDLERWRDSVASPLALADGGTLVLLDAAALPLDVQRLVGQALAERRAPWERPDAIDVVLGVTTVQRPRALADAGKLDAILASRLGEAIDDPIFLPAIAERPEDIRALVTDRLAREGLRVRGAPVGIDDAAFAILVDHPFEGEDAELATIVQKLVARIDGDVVREGDIRAVLGDQLVAAAPSVISPKPLRRGS